MRLLSSLGAVIALVGCNVTVEPVPEPAPEVPSTPTPPNVPPPPATTTPTNDPPPPPARCTKPTIVVSDATSSGSMTSTVETRSPLAGTSVESHYVAIYESARIKPATENTASVRVERAGHHVLHLASHTATSWTVIADPGAIIDRVVVYGYGVQKASVPAGVKLEIKAYESNNAGWNAFDSSCVYSPERKCTTQGVFETLESALGGKFVSFAGAYRATGFVIGSGGACTAPAPNPPSSKLPCTALGYGPGGGTALFSFDLATIGSASPDVIGVPLEPWYIDSAGRRGDDIYVCDGTVTRIKRHGAVERSDVSCSAVTANESALWVYTMAMSPGSPNLIRYADWASLVGHTSNASLSVTGSFSRIAKSGNDLLGAWHSTDRLLRIDTTTGATSELILEGYDDWIFGLDTLPDGRIVVAAPARAGGIRTFDATGKSLTQAWPDNTFGKNDYYGVVCSP